MLNAKRDRSIESDFDAWLDAFVAGQAALRSPGADATSVTERQDAASRFHALAAARAGTSLDGPSAELDTIWGNVMERTMEILESAPRSMPSANEAADRRRARRLSAELPGGPKVQAAINSLLAAGLILAVMAGFWRVTGGFSPGGDDGQELPFGAAVATNQAGTPAVEGAATSEVPPYVRPTPSLTGDPSIDMPTASDCNVAPLSIDDVLAIADDPSWEDNRSPAFMREQEASPDRANYGTEGRGYTYVGTPPETAALERIAATHRERIACAMKGSWFHVWALTDAPLIYDDVVERLYPTYITKEGARALLEELHTTGKAGGLPLLSDLWNDFQYIDLVDPDAESSHVMFEGWVEVGTLLFEADGRQRSDGAVPVVPADPITEREEIPLTYVWSEDAGRWLVWQLPGQYGLDDCVPTVAGCH